jgi:predicted nucleic acid-binding protein
VFQSPILIADALTIAIAYEITAYDASYMALAHHMSVPFVTADEALVRKLDGTGYDILSLGSFASPSRSS